MSVVLFLFFRIPYRTFIYERDYFDFYIADTSPNFFSVLVLVFYFKWSSKEKLNNFFICLSVGLGLVIYEYLQNFLSAQTVDYKDVIASLFGFLISYYICNYFDIKTKYVTD